MERIVAGDGCEEGYESVSVVFQSWVGTCKIKDRG